MKSRFEIGGYLHLYADKWLKLDPELIPIEPEAVEDYEEFGYSLLIKVGQQIFFPYHEIVFTYQLPEQIRKIWEGTRG